MSGEPSVSQKNAPLDYTIFQVTMTIAVPNYCVEHQHLVDVTSWISLDADAIMLGITEEPLTLT
jgi:hypothetical protein